ncbi:MAG: histidine kinase, partial [Sphingopyxis macrogoltabida]
MLLERLPLAAGRPIFGYVAAVALAGLALAARMAVADWLPPGFPFVTFFPAVILSAFLFGLKPGILTAILCGIASIPFFPTPPDGQLFGIGGIVALGFYTFVVVTDIALVHWMQRANARLAAERERTATLAERSDLLFSELQHRVSNNLQVVASLLHLQRRNISDETARTALAESARRLELIGRIHRQLHDPNGVQVGNTLFFQQLGDGLVEAEGRPEVRCQVMADDAIILKPEQVVPV